MEKTVFVLGAKDMEMDTIELILLRLHPCIGYAAIEGKRCHAGNAYMATQVVDNMGSVFPIDQPLYKYIFIECKVASVTPALVIDHHNPGDPGYDMPGSDGLTASSIGQLHQYLGIPIPAYCWTLAAADHNLAAAYAGQVPGVTSRMVYQFRVQELKNRNQVSMDTVEKGIASAKKLLLEANSVNIGGESVRDLRNAGVLPYLIEAAIMEGFSFIGRVDIRDAKKVFLSAKKETIEAFLSSPLPGVTNTYGSPARGFAGGTTQE